MRLKLWFYEGFQITKGSLLDEARIVDPYPRLDPGERGRMKHNQFQQQSQIKGTISRVSGAMANGKRSPESQPISGVIEWKNTRAHVTACSDWGQLSLALLDLRFISKLKKWFSECCFLTVVMFRFPYVTLLFQWDLVTSTAAFLSTADARIPDMQVKNWNHNLAALLLCHLQFLQLFLL